MKKVLKTLLFILGAPAILAVVAATSVVIYQRGISYSFWPFVGLILTAVFCLVFIITFIITGKQAKKKGTKKSVFKGTVALVIIAFIFTAGLWMIIDIPLPGILDDATSGTVTFDDVREDYVFKANEHGDLLDNFIRMNYDIENLTWESGEFSEEEKEAYVEEGYRNERVKELVHKNYISLNDNGYVTFVGPWIDFADGGRMTMPTLIHLVIDKREYEPKEFYLMYDLTPHTLVTKNTKTDFATKEKREDDTAPVTWTVLDMQGGSMDIALTDILINALGSKEGVDTILLLLNELAGQDIAAVLKGVNSALATEEVAGAPLYATLNISDAESAKLSLVSATTTRGMHGYMHTAWLDSNHLLFAVISLFPARHWLYILGSWLMFTAVAVGSLRYSEFAKDKDDDAKSSDEKSQNFGQGNAYGGPIAQPSNPYAPRVQYGPNPHDGYYQQEFNPQATPYQRAHMAATRERNQRLY